MSEFTSNGISGRMRNFFDSVPKRTQRMAIVLCVLLGVMYVLGFAYFTIGGLQTAQEDLAQREESLGNLKMMRGQFEQANRDIQAAEARLGQNKGVAPSAFLEQAASNAGVKDQLERIDERDSETVGSLKQTRYQVTVKMAPVKNTMSFLYAIEDSGFLAVESVDIRSKFFSGEKRLTSTIDLVAYASAGEQK